MPRLLLATICLVAASPAGLCQTFTDLSAATGFNATGFNRGVAIGDFDNDGLEDIYVSRLAGTNLLYRNLGDFQFEEVAAEYGVDHPQSTTTSVWFDLDRDGDLDLFLANLLQPNVLYRNDGNGFTDVSNTYGIGTAGNARSVNAVDYDNDGDLDIYVAQVLAQNILWRNEDGQSFTNVTEEAGIDDTGRSLGAIFFDYDLDGDQDLYQTADGDDPNTFWQNNGNGTFTEISAAMGLDGITMGMGADVMDLNGDGRSEIYLTNLHENKLFLGSSSGSFGQIAGPAGVDDIGMSWSAFFFDCNNDGQEDIYLANESKFGVDGQTDIPNRMFLCTGTLKFRSADSIGGVQNILSSYGAAWSDFDNDGRLDIAVANSGPAGGNQIFRNTGAAGNFIQFHLRGKVSNTYGIGSRLELFRSGQQRSKSLTAGSGYASQNSSRLHFGLGDAEEVDSVVIYWPSGTLQTLYAPGINQLHTIEEDAVEIVSGAVVWTEPPFPTQADDITVYFNAQEGNGALAGYTGDVYAHAGLITSESNSGTDWKHVIGDWGTADERVLMTREDTDLYSLSYNITTFHNIPPGEEVLQLAFVFRNVNGTIVGRDTDGSDIYVPVYPPEESLFVTILSPKADEIIMEGDSLLVQLNTSGTARIRITDNGQPVFDDSTDVVSLFQHPAATGPHVIDIEVSNENDTLTYAPRYYVVRNDLQTVDPPAGVRDGLNYHTDSTYVFQLFAPGKAYAFVMCPHSEYWLAPEFRMHMSADSATFWLELPRSHFANGSNAYLYFVDDKITVPDPYSEVILDPRDDALISPDIMSGLPEHPGGSIPSVTVFETDVAAYPWSVTDFVKPMKTDLVIYELLIRDFLQDHSYTSLIDTLDYLARLGVNAIELMPIQEFEGNESWGYNPSLHGAVDKYYGTKEQLKAFIDAAHSRGMAVILDVVFNHAFGQSPLVQLYRDATNFRPSPDNPWLNVTPRHPFNVGYDFNHESPATKVFVKRVLERWIKDYRFDGFRFDLSKGFTQRNSGDNEAFMAQYDAGRIAILKEYADYIWSLDSSSYVILEHFAENDEEIELSDYGMMIWAGDYEQFKEAAMGYASDLELADYTHRGWSNPHLVGYIESHDEERTLYKVLMYGDAAGDYNTRDLTTALRRAEAVNAIFYTIPGPKMLWQFGELGYDYSITRCADGTLSNDCRVENKPIRWDYYTDPRRRRLFDVTKALIHLKTHYPTFATTDFEFQDGNFYLKTVHLNHPDMDAVVLANFRVINSDITPRFRYPGTWYEYFTGDSLEVVDVQEKITFVPGEYRIYTSKRITPPNGFILSSTTHPATRALTLAPNPISHGDQVMIALDSQTDVLSATLCASDGRVMPIALTGESTGTLRFRLDRSVAPGVYVVRLATSEAVYIGKVIVVGS